MIGQSFNTSLFFLNFEGCELSPTIDFPFLRNLYVSFCVKLNDLSMAPISVIYMTSADFDFTFPSWNLLSFPEFSNIWGFKISILNIDNTSIRTSNVDVINGNSIAVTCACSHKSEDVLLVGFCVKIPSLRELSIASRCNPS